MTQSSFQDSQENLFSDNKQTENLESQPLASRMRPRTIEEFIGQEHIVSAGKPLYESIRKGLPHSMILWGPPGVGKTTLARIIAKSSGAHFESISAVLAGVKEIREAISRARTLLKSGGRATLLFIDEVHRFNKSQQDAFLPHIENGTVIFVGATTENPSFELNNALLSRARVYVLKSLQDTSLNQVILQALADESRGLGNRKISLSEQNRMRLAVAADGDARKALNLLEIASDLATEDQSGTWDLNEEVIAQVLQGDSRRFDKGGDSFYEQISALHKAVRGTSSDGALYWFARMLDGGCDPVYIARRLVRMASEDIGNADPRGIQIALNAWDVQTRLGSPEGELALAQALVYLASAPKSNAVYKAFNLATAEVKNTGSLEVPMHLRNAPTALMKDMNYGEEYRYAHDENKGYAAGENYFPFELRYSHYYSPGESGLEKKIKEKLDYFRQLDLASEKKRYHED